jgi:hypothetical protein
MEISRLIGIVHVPGKALKVNTPFGGGGVDMVDAMMTANCNRDGWLSLRGFGWV